MADASVAVLETLRLRGWNFADSDEVKAVIMIGSALADDPSSVVDSVESELINMDLRSIGGKSLSEPALLRKSSRILGPIVLQVNWTPLMSFVFVGERDEVDFVFVLLYFVFLRFFR